MELAVAEKLVYGVSCLRGVRVHLNVGGRRLGRGHDTASERVQRGLLAGRHNMVLSGVGPRVHRIVTQDGLSRRRILQVRDLSATHAVSVAMLRSIEHHG